MQKGQKNISNGYEPTGERFVDTINNNYTISSLSQNRDNMPKNLYIALEFFKNGWFPIPLCWAENGKCSCRFKDREPHTGNDVGKAPIYNPKDYVTEKKIRRWWTDFPHANIGIQLERSKLVCVDADSPAAVDEVNSMHPLPPSPIVKTGNGMHRFFKRPPHAKVGRTIQCGQSGKIDILADGYVVAPPSIHASGRKYKWEIPPRMGIADAPEWVVEFLKKAKTEDERAKTLDVQVPNFKPVDVDQLTVHQRIKDMITSGTGTKYGGEPYKTNSEMVFAVIWSLMKNGYDDQTIFSILADPKNKIDCKDFHKNNKWNQTASGRKIMRQVARARDKFNQNEAEKGIPTSLPKDMPMKLDLQYFAADSGGAAAGEEQKPKAKKKKSGGKYFDDFGFVPKRLADEIMQEYRFFSDGNLLYIYDNGVYKRNAEKEISKIVLEKLGNQFRKNRNLETTYIIQTAARVVDESQINPTDRGLINVKNGILDWRSGKLYPHTPKFLSTIQIPIEYNPNAQCPAVEQFFKSVIPEDTIPTMLEWFGYSLVPQTKYKKAMLLTGGGNNGKSVVIDLYSILIGEENIANVPLQDLEHGQFYRAAIFGKLANAFADIPAKVLDSSHIFKTIVAGDRIMGEFKGRDPFFFRPYAKCIYSANELPPSRDVGEAFFNRWLIIPFENQFIKGVNADPDILAKITTPAELSGLLNLAIKGLQRLEKNDGFTIGPTIKEALAEYQKNIDPISNFIEDCCVVDPENPNIKAYSQELYNAYRLWLDRNGYKKFPTQTAFALDLKRRFPKDKDRKGNFFTNIGICEIPERERVF